MHDLNDLFFFSQVVENGGFAAAGRALRQPKSKLSRRVAFLETRLGVRLLERSTRQFRVTEIGAVFYDRCRAILNEVERAEALTAEARSAPQGVVRMSCPTGLVEPLMRFLPELLATHPGIRLQLVATDRRVALIDERIDVAVRVRTALDTDAELSVRSLRKSRRLLVASPDFVRENPSARDLDALATLPTLSSTEDTGDVAWELVDTSGERRTVNHRPRFSSGDFGAVRRAAMAGLGVAFLPDHVCNESLASGALVRMFHEWQGLEGILHLVFTTRRGLPPAVRAVIDHLAACLRHHSL